MFLKYFKKNFLNNENIILLVKILIIFIIIIKKIFNKILNYFVEKNVKRDKNILFERKKWIIYLKNKIYKNKKLWININW